MTTTPFEERPDPVAQDGTAADPGPQDVAPDSQAPADTEGDREDLMPEGTPFRTPEVTD